MPLKPLYKHFTNFITLTYQLFRILKHKPMPVLKLSNWVWLLCCAAFGVGDMLRLAASIKW